MTSSNGNIFHVTGPLCGEVTGHRWLPSQRPVTQRFDVFFICASMTGSINNREAGTWNTIAFIITSLYCNKWMYSYSYRMRSCYFLFWCFYMVFYGFCLLWPYIWSKIIELKRIDACISVYTNVGNNVLNWTVCHTMVHVKHRYLNDYSDVIMSTMASQITSVPMVCLLKRLFRRRSKKTSKFRFTGLCGGNSPVTGEFPAQRASNAENVSIWWRHHVTLKDRDKLTSHQTTTTAKFKPYL